MGIRRKGREITLQTLYALDFCETDPYLGKLEYLNLYKDKLQDICLDDDIEIDSNIYEFADKMLQSTLKNISFIDDSIDSHCKNWSIDRLASLDKNIMRIAVNEISFSKTPLPIIINEAIEISKKYCTEKTGRFINGVLHAVSVDLRKKKSEEKDEKA